MPLVEFQLEEGITDVEALRLIESEGGSGSGADSKWQDGGEAENVLRLGEDGDQDQDPFTTRLFSFQQDGGTFAPVVASRAVLQSLGPGEVVVCRWPPPLRNTYYRNLMPDMAITKCQTCNKVSRHNPGGYYNTSSQTTLKVFHSDDYELQLLQKGHCPFCR